MRNTTKILATSLTFLLLISVSTASAQRRHGLVDVSPWSERHGLWLNFGVAAGGENYRFSKGLPGWNRQDDLVKPAFSIAVGGTVNPHLRLGGEINAWVNEYTDPTTFDHVTESLVGGYLVGQMYPIRQLGLYVKGGLGISRSGTDISGGFGTGETGFSYLYGAGWEVKLARNFFLTPSVGMIHHYSSQGANDPTDPGTLHERVWTVGVGLTFQPGR